MTVAESSLRFFRSHPAIAGTILYLYASAVGGVYEAVYFSAFGINAFEFADANDFLLAALRQPRALLLLAVSLFAYGGVMLFRTAIENAIDSRSARLITGPSIFARLAGRSLAATLVDGPFWAGTMGKWLARTVFTIAFVAYSVLPMSLAAIVDAARVKRSGESVQVALRGTTEPLTLVFVGTTERYLFLYDPDAGATHVVPSANVETITFMNPTDAR